MCRRTQGYYRCTPISRTPVHSSLLLSAVTKLLDSKLNHSPAAWGLSESQHKQLPARTMTARTRKEIEASQQASGVTETQTWEQTQSLSQTQPQSAARTGPYPEPDEPPPAYQDVIAELPGSSTAAASRAKDYSDSGSDTEPEGSSNQQNPISYIPGDNKYQADGGHGYQADADLPQPLQGDLSNPIRTKVDTLLAALDAYREGRGRKLPVKRARRDLMNQLYEEQISNQEKATGQRVSAREKSVIWRELKGLRDDMWLMVKEAKRARKQW